MPGPYSSGSGIVVDAQLAFVISQILTLSSMCYEERTRAPPAAALWFALISSGERLEQSPVTWRYINVIGLAAWVISAA